MSDDEWRAFVLSGTRTGKVAITRPDGRPHVTPVWFLLDGPPGADEVVFTTWSDCVKGRVLRASPQFAMCVDDQVAPYSYVLLTCRATLTTDPAELFTWASRIGARYMGAEAAEAYGRRNSATGELLVRGRIESIVALADIAD